MLMWVSYNEEGARVLLAYRVGYHDDTYILTCETKKIICSLRAVKISVIFLVEGKILVFHQYLYNKLRLASQIFVIISKITLVIIENSLCWLVALKVTITR